MIPFRLNWRFVPNALYTVDAKLFLRFNRSSLTVTFSEMISLTQLKTVSAKLLIEVGIVALQSLSILELSCAIVLIRESYDYIFSCARSLALSLMMVSRMNGT